MCPNPSIPTDEWARIALGVQANPGSNCGRSHRARTNQDGIWHPYSGNPIRRARIEAAYRGGQTTMEFS